jgi:hypothetical protein
MKEPKIETSWDKKKIAVAIIILLGLIATAIYFSGAYKIKSANVKNSDFQIKKSVNGISESINVKGVKGAVQQKIEEIKTEAGSIDIAEIASSSPQVQKILNDIKSLENYPGDQAKNMCEKICNSF